MAWRKASVGLPAFAAVFRSKDRSWIYGRRNFAPSPVRAKVRLAECLACKTDWHIDQIEKSVNELFKKVSRPGFSAERDDDDLARKDATQLCIIKRALVVPKNDGNTAEYAPLNRTLPGSYVRAR